MTTSCCPILINLLKRHLPQQYEENMSTTVSPVCTMSRYLRAMRPGCVTVFIGPCVAKKSESVDRSVPDNVDYVMTYGEFNAFLRSADAQLKPEGTERQGASTFGKRFAIPGGAANTMLGYMSERGEDVSEIKLLRCAGGAEYKKVLQFLKFGKIAGDFTEGTTCPSGCVGGPLKHKTETRIRRSRETFLKRADDRRVLDSLKSHPMKKFSIYRDGHRDLEELGHAEGEA